MIEAITVEAFLSIISSIGGSIDLSKKEFSIKWGSFEIKGIKFPMIKALAENPAKMEKVLSTIFIQKRIMWFDMKMERTLDCVTSLNDLKNKINEELKVFENSEKSEDKLITSYLFALKNISIECEKDFKNSIRNADESKSEIDESWESEEDIPEVLGKFRNNSYPIIQSLMEYLKKDNVIRNQCIEKLNSGKDQLIKFYNVNNENMNEALLYEE